MREDIEIEKIEDLVNSDSYDPLTGGLLPSSY